MKMNKKTQVSIAIGLVLVVLMGVGIFAYTQMRPSAPAPEEAPKKRRAADPVNVLPVAERPYLQIQPLSDGRNLELVVVSLNKPATEVEYELEYQAGSLLQGAFGAIDLNSVPARAKILLGSCSAGGACTYHEDVKGGTLLTRYSGESGYALKSDWRYITNTARETEIASKDAKFQLESPELKTQRHLIVFNTPGVPDGLTGTLASESYSLTSSSPLKGKGTLTIRANEEGELKIMGWNGTAWTSFDTKVDGKSATATVDLMELYVVVK